MKRAISSVVEENIVRNKIELLDIGLLNDVDKLKVIDHWLGVMNWSNGWHYDLDIIWLLKQIERLNLPKGATVIDAGAGLGITQFMLALYGYNVISLDFVDRQIPRFAKNIFVIEKINHDLKGYTHEYMDFMNYKCSPGYRKCKEYRLGEILNKVFNLNRFRLNIYIARNCLKEVLNLEYILEAMKDHSGFGKITFLRGTFNSIPLADNSVDALISISAFEHNTYEDMPGSIKEFMRVVKKGSPIFITTSATEKHDWYFNPSKAWNLSKHTLSSWFGIPESNITFDYSKIFDHIVHSRILERRMPLSYKLCADNGLPYGRLKEAQYIPVGIVKVKDKNVF